MRRHAFAVACFLAVTGVAYAQEFSARQLRVTSAVQAVDVALSPYGSYTAFADTTEGNSVRVLDENWELLWRHRQPVYWGGTFRHAPMLQFAPDESFLLFPAYRTENDIGVVDPKTGQPLAVLTGHSDSVDCLALSPDGSRVVSTAGQELFLWRREGAGFALVDKLADHKATVGSLAFTPDGALVAATEYEDTARRIVLYRVNGPRIIPAGRYENQENNLGHEYSQVAFSPDGRWLATGYAESLLVLERTGESLKLAQKIPDIELGSVLSVAFSPDGAFLLSGHVRDVRAWRIRNGSWTEAATFTPHIGLVRALRFSLDGTHLAIAGRADTNSLGLWSISGAGPSPLGRLFGLLKGRLSAAQKHFLSDAPAQQILAGLSAEEAAPRDMFETEQEYAARLGRAQARAASLLQELTERQFAAERAAVSGAMYEVAVPLQAQGTYAIDTKTYTLRFMDTEATVKLERDAARELYQNWQRARIRATRLSGPAGTTYDDFRVALPVSGQQFPVGLSENPFTGELLDRYGARVPSMVIGPDLLVRNLALEGVFPALYHSYADNALGTATFQNTGSTTITELSVQLFVPGLMKTPTEAIVSTSMAVGQSQDVGIRALFDPSVLDRTEGGVVTAELTIRYREGEKSWVDTIRRPVGLLNRNAMRWTDDRKVGAFMVVSEPSFLRFSGQVMGMGQDLATNVLTRNLLSAARMFEAMKAVGVRYVVDPSSAYETLSRDATAIDFVRFPAETLDAKSGDCDDLAVLYNSLLESVGVDTAFITTPGHIYAAFASGISPELAERSFGSLDDLIVRDGVVWFPVETTMIDDGFVKAWQTGAAEWREAGGRATVASAGGGASTDSGAGAGGTAAGAAGFFTAREAWQHYLPAGFTGSPPGAPPASDRLLALTRAEIDAFRAAVLKPREAQLLKEIDDSPTPAQENQLGVLYAQFGLLEKAADSFEKASAANYLPGILNAANVCSLQKSYDRAQEYLKRAERLQPGNARVLIALAFSYYQSGNEPDAKSTYERMSRIDPGLAARYPLFSTAADGSARAGRTDSASALFGGDWVP